MTKTISVTVRIPKPLAEKARALAARDSERVAIVLRRWLRQGSQGEQAPATAETAA